MLKKMRTDIELRMASAKRDPYIDGYVTGEREMLERACRWWRDHIVGFLNDGLADGIVEEFRNAMGKE